MHLIEQFRARSPDGRQHTIACYQDPYDRPIKRPNSTWEHIVRFRLNGAAEVSRIDDHTFVTDTGVVLQRERR